MKPKKQRSFRAIYESRLLRAPKGATGRQARTFPVMARALRDLPERWLPEDAGQVWVWSDLHLGHTNIIRYCDRPFRDAGHMDNALLDNWAQTVDWSAESDAIAMKRGMTATNFGRIAAMPGRKILVPGNHDFGGAGELRVKGFSEVCAGLYADGDPKLIFTHVPIEADHLPDGWVNVHGHMHDDPPTDTCHINVSVEQLEYAPVLLSRIRVLAPALVQGVYPAGRTTLEQIEALEAEGPLVASRSKAAAAKRLTTPSKPNRFPSASGYSCGHGHAHS